MNTKTFSGYKIGVIYLLSALILTFYGVEVCPFLETLRHEELFIIITIPFLIGWGFRAFFLKMTCWNISEPDYPWRIVWLDMFLWFSIGIVITAWNFIFYDFPIGSGLKVVLGCITLGFYSSIFIFLKLDHALITSYFEKNNQREPQYRIEFVSISTKFFLFSLLTILFTTAILLLLVYKDFQYVISSLSQGTPFKFSWIVYEILFVFGLLLFGILVLTRQYSINLRLIFSKQLSLFQQVEKGDLDTSIPIASNDELGLIAKHANTMIKGLKEKRKIKETFGKYIDPSIANIILKESNSSGLAGKETKACVLFSDIRNFTRISETLPSSLLLKNLNSYFSLLVTIIHKHNGVLDKFIGDAAMGVFGLDASGTMSSDALNAAIEIQHELTLFNEQLRQQGDPLFITGIGIHTGTLIAGTIGSPERMEYTVIGDVVNTASRIESATKELGHSILISEDTYTDVHQSLRDQLIKARDFSIRGKAQKILLYHLDAT